jgi:hypothetical protein
MGAPGFWDDPAKSAPIVQRRSAIERQVQVLEKLRAQAGDLEAWRELTAEGEADALLEAAYRSQTASIRDDLAAASRAHVREDRELRPRSDREV